MSFSSERLIYSYIFILVEWMYYLNYWSSFFLSFIFLVSLFGDLIKVYINMKEEKNQANIICYF